MKVKYIFLELKKSKNKALIGLFFTFLTVSIFLINAGYYSSDEYDSFVQDRIEQISKNADDVIFEIKANIKSDNENILDFQALLNESIYPVYIYKKGVLSFWSDNNLKLKYLEDKLYSYFVEDVIQKDDSFYYVRKSNIMVYNQDYEIFVIIPLVIQRDNVTSLIPNYVNEFVFGTKEMPRLAKFNITTNYKSIYTKLNKFLFALDVSQNRSVELIPWSYFVMSIIIGVLFLLSALSTFVTNYINRGYSIFPMLTIFILGVISLHAIVADVLSSNIIKYEYNILDKIDDSVLSQWDSLGIIFLDILFAILIFRWLSRNFTSLFSIKSIYLLDKKYKIAISVVLIVSFFFIVAGFEEIFIHVSAKAGDLSLKFSLLDITVPEIFAQVIIISGFILMGLIAHLFFKLICWALDFYSKSLAMLISIVIIFGFQLGYDTFNILLINIIAIFVGITLLLDTPKYLSIGKFPAVMYLMSLIVFFSLLGAFITENLQIRNDEVFKQKFASKLTENDALLRAYLQETINGVKNDNQIIDAMAFLNKGRAAIATKSIKNDLTEWFGNRFDVKINISFDNGQTLNNENSYQQLKDNFYEKQKPKYGLNSKMNLQQGTFSYLCDIPIVDRFEKTDTLGFCLIALYPKSLTGKSFKSTILDEDFDINFRQEEYSYAIFYRQELIFSSGDYNYSNSFLKETYSKDRENLVSSVEYKGYEHLMLPGSNNRIVVISSKRFAFIDYFKSFSAYFTVLIILIFTIFNMVNYYRNPNEYRRSFSTKVQLYLNAAIFLPLLILAFVMGSVMVNSTKNDVQRQYLEKGQTVASNLFQDNEINKLYSNDDNLKLDVLIDELSNVMQADIRFYNRRGKLKAASDIEIFDENLLSKEINPKAYIAIMQNKQTRLVLKERIGNLEYNTSYIGIKAFNTGRVMGVVSIPFFKSLHKFDDRSIEVITTIMMIFSILFLTLLPIVHYAALSLLNPIKLIIPELNRITLSKKNEPITYTANDEFGQLVGEYNKMLAKLEESKKELDRSQRESAWRDVAKQVAHEIKNPLTPMKLYLQQLERVAKSDENPKLMKATKMLINQVDTLSGIVTSFSSFATMPVPKRETFNISKVIRENIMLLSSKTDIHFSDTQIGHDVMVEGDEKLTARILNNLMLNGIQAAKDDVPSKIIVDLYENGEKAIVTIIDNGMGIPEDVQNKVFVPNFTTKETGSGIGLAVAKRGVEQMGGSIWFETKELEGSSFFVEFLMTEIE
ncbi:sensor histidine kinase [Flammeovirga kamogawensis]|uniref:histidine kinase n=1 Tax=Flammeovirga kamogawensis TaxID=373891 RepID=A0ABX8GW50_9BACT|nr:HAMP domain-containing sensor histidine kinase [Flammeovirga kamogawensis]MBB6461271.1 signal transduction histidine kinase [Flammeovirga kamogawensis]QWG07830.1 HAMP domain-containing histidine kinase [Flammeovirga kamogawensis]TRX69635.1 HAMP domain-containing histidine kinase [Flammeovirga kamogawensis]